MTLLSILDGLLVLCTSAAAVLLLISLCLPEDD